MDEPKDKNKADQELEKLIEELREAWANPEGEIPDLPEFGLEDLRPDSTIVLFKANKKKKKKK